MHSSPIWELSTPPFCLFTSNHGFCVNAFSRFNIVPIFDLKKPAMKRNLFFATCIYVSLSTVAQPKNGTVNGSVNGSNNSPLDAATVLLLKQKDSSVAKAAVTDRQGRFIMSKIAWGKYILTASAAGYQDFKTALLILDSSNHDLAMPVISLSPSVKNLGNVSVTTQRPFLERKIDKLVVNVSSSPVNAGQSALDVLERSPGVIIDENENISLNGKQGTAIFIDGKISYLAGHDLANYLRGLPAAQLDQVEIITQPSSKYDAEGISGIINLKLKKNQNNGFSGGITTTAIFGKYFKTRDNLTLNWKKGKLNTTASYGISDTRNFSEQHTMREFRTDYSVPFNSYLDQNLYVVNGSIPHNVRITADLAASKNTTIGAVVTGFFALNKPGVSGRSDQFDSLHTPVSYTLSTTTPHNTISNAGFNLNLLQKLDKKGKELTADADYVFYHNLNQQVTENDLYNMGGVLQDAFILRNHIPLGLDIYSFKSDYSQPLKKEGKLEAGIKNSYVKTDNDGQYSQYDQQLKKWVADTGLSNHFIYRENINAAYVNYNQKLGKKWSLQTGLRWEQTIAKGNQLTKRVQFEKNYSELFPTIYIRYAPDDKHTFTASYGRGINRPGYQELNPFLYYIDKFNAREGNPDLKPFFSNDFELAYNYNNQLNIAAGYTHIKNAYGVIFRNELQGTDHVLVQQRGNIAFRRFINFSVDYNRAIKKWWKFTGSAFAFNNYFAAYSDPALPASSATVLILNISNQFPLKKGWTLDASGVYRSKRLEGGYVHVLPSYYFSAGVSKKLMKNKATLTLNMNDPFWLLRSNLYSEQSSFYTRTNSKPENRWLTMTFNYRFGKSVNQKRRDTGSSQDEQNRAGF